MKKIYNIIALLLLAFSLTACGNKVVTDYPDEVIYETSPELKEPAMKNMIKYALPTGPVEETDPSETGDEAEANGDESAIISGEGLLRGLNQENLSEITYVCNMSSGKFHYPSCESVELMAEKNKKYDNRSREEIIADGYVPCKNCNP